MILQRQEFFDCQTYIPRAYLVINITSLETQFQYWRISYDFCRTYLYPLIFVPGFALLKRFGLDKGRLLVLAPGFTQGMICAIGDLYAYKFCRHGLNTS
jgi:hypothetical protein